MASGHVREAAILSGWEAHVVAHGLDYLLDRGWFAEAVPAGEFPRLLEAIASVRRAAEAWRALPISADGSAEAAETETPPSSGDVEVATDEVATMLKVTPARVRQLARAGVIGRKVAGRWRFNRSDVRREQERRAA